MMLPKRPSPEAFLNTLILVSLALATLVEFPHAHGEIINAKKGQYHFRTGMVNGSFSGPVSDSFSVMPAFIGEVEIARSRRWSWLAKGILAMDGATAKARYTYGGFGQRYYIWGTRGFPSEASQYGTYIKIKPKMRYHISYDAGIASVVVQSATATLDAVSTLLDFGGGAGFIYQFSENFGFEGQFHMSYGYGFSSVAVTAMTMKMTFGATYYF